jgi:hypothetical protein
VAPVAPAGLQNAPGCTTVPPVEGAVERCGAGCAGGSTGCAGRAGHTEGGAGAGAAGAEVCAADGAGTGIEPYLALAADQSAAIACWASVSGTAPAHTSSCLLTDLPAALWTTALDAGTGVGRGRTPVGAP